MHHHIKKFSAASLALLMFISVSFAALGADISLNEARSIALSDANVKSNDAVFTKTKIETDGGRKVYEVEFRVSTDSSVTEYEYEILASTGKILDREKETKSVTMPSAGKNITREQAVAIALKSAGVKEKKALKLTAKQDNENGKRVYEVEFYVKKDGKLIEYDYTILVSNGQILKKESSVEAKAPAKVSSLKVKAKTDTTVTLKWSRSKGADGYLVYRYDSAQKKYVKIAAVKARSYKATGLKADTTYKFAVRSYVREDGITLACTGYTKRSVKTA
nr:PepSY domain-containing protein [uncultured Ruminococcus sp.]